MNGLDLLCVALAVGFGFYLGKDFYFVIMELIDRAADKTKPHRFTMYLLLGVVLVVLVWTLISVEIPFGNVPL